VLDIEIVSMDSRQVYIGMDIGTDKVGTKARAHVPHHGLDLVQPSERYSAGRFARDVRTWVPAIEARERVPVLVGGTGFFLKAVMEPIFEEPALDETRLTELRSYLMAQDVVTLRRWVRALDPERSELAIEGGPQRMSRTLEIALLSGRPLSWWHREAPAEVPGLPGVVVTLELAREEMDRRIAARVERMIDRGLVEEVRSLLDGGYSVEAPGMSGTGYREIAAYLGGDVSLDDAKQQIRLSTRRYARRQLTWFRNQLPEDSVRIDAEVPLARQVERVLEAWEEGR
jgi:tRNA dimethylallyltransferase